MNLHQIKNSIIKFVESGKNVDRVVDITTSNLSDDQKKIQQIQLKIGETTARIEKHISRVFHRFIDNKNIEKDVRRINIFLNEKEIKPNNPFNEYNNATFISPLTKVPLICRSFLVTKLSLTDKISPTTASPF